MATKADALDQRAAAELDVEIIPGTEIMTDVGDVHFAHAGGKGDGSVYVTRELYTRNVQDSNLSPVSCRTRQITRTVSSSCLSRCHVILT